MRGWLGAALLLITTAFAGIPAGGQSGCTDVHETFTGTTTGVPDESLVGTSVEATDYPLELGSDECRIVDLDAQLTSPESGTTGDAELVVTFEGIEIVDSRNPGTEESAHLDEPPVGSYVFTVEPWLANATSYELTIDATLASDPAEDGPNADDETVVIAVPDTGINPYHDEFSAESYPGALDLSEHPSNYLTGYPHGAQALDLSLDTSYDNAVSQDDWDSIEEGQLYWIPGTKIIGAIDDGSFTSGGDATPLLDDHGHGTGSASVAAGNTVGTCERCLLVVVEGLHGFEWALSQPWIDLVSNSWGRIANVGTPSAGTAASPAAFFGLDDSRTAQDLRAAVTRGQTVLFAAGNGNANAFATTQNTYTSPLTGPDWVITVGATQKFDDCDCSTDEGSILGSGKPVDISSYASGDIPAADHRSTSGGSQHGGTSAATPISAGVMGESLLEAREALGDTTSDTQDPVIAEGSPVGNGLLDDGQLTRAELELAITRTAEHTQSGWIGIYPTVLPTFALPHQTLAAQWMAEGWGVVVERTGNAATDVILGNDPLPERPLDAQFAAEDEANRAALWGQPVEP